MTAPVADPSAARPAAKPPGILRVAFRMWRTRIGLLIAIVLAFVALFGRWFAPYGEQEPIGIPFTKAGQTRLPSRFGSADVGLDVWSRFLYGGRPILIAAVLSTLLALVVGGIVGLTAAYNRRRLDGFLMRVMDIILAMPQIIIALVVLSMFGGVELFGGWGLLLGPLLVRLAKEALVISREARDPATASPQVETTSPS